MIQESTYSQAFTHRKETSEAIHCREIDFSELLKRQSKEKIFNIAGTTTTTKMTLHKQGNSKKVNRNRGDQKAVGFKELKVKTQPPKKFISRKTLKNES